MAPGSREGSTSARSTDSASGKIAVAAPCSTRATMSHSMELVVAASTDPATMTTSTPSRVGFVPCWSPKRPRSGVKTAADSSVAVVTQLTCAVVAPRSFWMMPRIGMTRVCIIDTTMAARPSTRTRLRLPVRRFGAAAREDFTVFFPVEGMARRRDASMVEESDH